MDNLTISSIRILVRPYLKEGDFIKEYTELKSTHTFDYILQTEMGATLFVATDVFKSTQAQNFVKYRAKNLNYIAWNPRLGMILFQKPINSNKKGEK